MATVYLAADLRHERKVALKVLKPELAAVVGAERFLAEIKTTANLQHPHILALYDSGEADGFLFFVGPFVEGESLRDRLDREKQLPVEDAVRIASEVADALDYAHRQRVIHRDIKPGNILLHEGRVLVADFGIALAVGAAGGDRITETGLSLGTPHYMSPEQAIGDQQVGPPTDTYALGCVLYEMLVGTPPYIGGTAQAVLGKIITGTPDPVTEHREGPPPHVHFDEDEEGRVVSGTLSALVGGQQLEFDAGEELDFPRGMAHRWWNAGDEVLTFEGFARPLVDLDRYLQAVFQVVNAGPEGRPPLFYMAHALRRHRATQSALVVPGVVQAILFPLVVGLGTLLGKYRGTDWPGCPARCTGAPLVVGDEA